MRHASRCACQYEYLAPVRSFLKLYPNALELFQTAAKMLLVAAPLPSWRYCWLHKSVLPRIF